MVFVLFTRRYMQGQKMRENVWLFLMKWQKVMVKKERCKFQFCDNLRIYTHYQK